MLASSRRERRGRVQLQERKMARASRYLTCTYLPSQSQFSHVAHTTWTSHKHNAAAERRGPDRLGLKAESTPVS